MKSLITPPDIRNQTYADERFFVVDFLRNGKIRLCMAFDRGEFMEKKLLGGRMSGEEVNKVVFQLKKVI